MPLSKGCSRVSFGKNIGAMLNEGRPMKQALAIAYSTRRRAGCPEQMTVPYPKRRRKNPISDSEALLGEDVWSMSEAERRLEREDLADIVTDAAMAAHALVVRHGLSGYTVPIFLWQRPWSVSVIEIPADPRRASGHWRRVVTTSGESLRAEAMDDAWRLAAEHAAGLMEMSGLLLDPEEGTAKIEDGRNEWILWLRRSRNEEDPATLAE